jgi:hypothetical protein
VEELWTTLAVAVAAPLGASAILAAAILAAAGLAERINPTPPKAVEDEIRDATRLRDRQRELDDLVEGAEQVRGKESVDSTHVSFPVFWIALPCWLVLQTWAAALEHFDRPAEGFPLALAFRPLWTALIAAFLFAIVSGFFYRRWFRRQPWQRRAAIRARLEAKESRGFEARLKSIRHPASRRRSERY